jgi:hypothetical protein
MAAVEQAPDPTKAFHPRRRASSKADALAAPLRVSARPDTICAVVMFSLDETSHRMVPHLRRQIMRYGPPLPRGRSTIQPSWTSRTPPNPMGSTNGAENRSGALLSLPRRKQLTRREDTAMRGLFDIPLRPRREARRGERAEREAKSASRDIQGWAKGRPLTQRKATHSRDGRPYVTDRYGTIRKGARSG